MSDIYLLFLNDPLILHWWILGEPLKDALLKDNFVRWCLSDGLWFSALWITLILNRLYNFGLKLWWAYRLRKYGIPVKDEHQ